MVWDVSGIHFCNVGEFWLSSKVLGIDFSGIFVNLCATYALMPEAFKGQTKATDACKVVKKFHCTSGTDGLLPYPSSTRNRLRRLTLMALKARTW